MLSLKDISDWFDELISSQEWDFKQCNSLYYNAKDTKIMCVVESRQQKARDTMVGQKATFKTLDISLLIHYNKSFYETTDISEIVYDYLEDLTYLNSFVIGDNNINCIQLLSNNEDIGQDDNKIFERVIRIRFYYNKI